MTQNKAGGLTKQDIENAIKVEVPQKQDCNCDCHNGQVGGGCGDCDSNHRPIENKTPEWTVEVSEKLNRICVGYTKFRDSDLTAEKPMMLQGPAVFEVLNIIQSLLTHQKKMIRESIEMKFNEELKNNIGDLKTYRNIAQDKEVILSLPSLTIKEDER